MNRILLIAAAGLALSACRQEPPASLAEAACGRAAVAYLNGDSLVVTERYAFEGTVAFEGRLESTGDRIWVRCEMEGDKVARVFLDGEEVPEMDPPRVAA